MGKNKKKAKARGSGKFKKAKLLELAGESVALVGCGGGKYLEFAHRTGRSVVGVDISHARSVEANARTPGRVAVADARNLPFPDKSFDTVTLWDVLEHMEEDSKALKEALRVARCNVLFSVPAEDSFAEYSSGLTFRTYIDPTHRRYYTLARIDALMSLCARENYTVQKFHRARPALLYRRAGIPRGLLSVLDKILWLLGSKSETLMRSYFVEVRLESSRRETDGND